jgi:membrane protein
MWQKTWKLLDHALFGSPSEGSNPLARLLRVLRYPYAILRDLMGSELTLRATSLVYITLLALIPAIALALVLLKAFDAQRYLEPFLLEFFRPVGSGGPELVHRLMEFAERVSGKIAGIVGVFGLVSLLWTLVGTVNRIEDSMNYVWRVQRARSIPRRVVEFVALVMLGPLVVFAVIAFSKVAIDSVASVQEFSQGAQAAQLAIRIAPYAIVIGLFTAVYIMMPNTRVLFLPALGGGIAAGTAWVAIGKAFTALVIHSSRLTMVYAGFAAFIGVFVWTYVGWVILLAGAQLAFYLQNPHYLRLGHATLRLSNHEQERLALDIMARIAQGHRNGDPPWTVERLARALALPGIAVAEMAEHLEVAGLIAQADDCKLFPGREISGITVAEIITTARSRSSGHEPHPRLSLPGVRKVQEEMERAWRAACGNLTLADLIEPAEHPRPPA